MQYTYTIIVSRKVIFNKLNLPDLKCSLKYLMYDNYFYRKKRSWIIERVRLSRGRITGLSCIPFFL